MPGGMETFVGDHMWFALYLADAGTSEGKAAGYLATLRSRCEAIAADFAQGYIWQKDPLTFQLRQAEETEAGEPCIAGGLCFGDNVEDEWFATFILAQLTRQLPLIAKVEDTDGSFLLIEAADALPRWVDPDSAQNRVFLRDGCVHLVPQPRSPADFGILPPGSAHISQGLGAVRACPQRTVASQPIQQAIDRRLGVYPQHARESMHHTRCFLPKQILKYLEEHPQAVSAAVSCFYLRDPIDMKRCGRMATFPPRDRVMGPVVMSRCMYAQLKQQQFQPPPVFGRTPPPSSRDYDAHMLGAKLACGFEILASKAPVLDLQRLEEDTRFQRFLRGLQQHNYFGDNIKGSKAYREKMEAAKQAFLEKNAAAQRTSGHTAHDILQAHISRPDLGPDRLPRSVDEQPNGKANRAQHSTEGGNGNTADELALSSTQLAALRLRRRLQVWRDSADNSSRSGGGSAVEYTPPAHIREDSDEWMQMEPSEIDRLLSAYQMLTTEAAGSEADEATTQQQQQQQQQGVGEGSEGARGVADAEGGAGKGGRAEAEMDEEQVQDRLRAMADGISKFVNMESGFEGAVDLSDFFFEKDLAEGMEQPSDSDDEDDGHNDSAATPLTRQGGREEENENGDEDVAFDPERFLSGLKDLLRLGEEMEAQRVPAQAADAGSKGKTGATNKSKKVRFAPPVEEQQSDVPMATHVQTSTQAQATEMDREQGAHPNTAHVEMQGESKQDMEEEDDEEEEDPFADVHAQIEEELKGSFVRHGYVKAPTEEAGERADQGGSGGEHDAPVALDFNLVHNLLQSYGAQQGVAGPASTLLNTTAALRGTAARGTGAGTKASSS